MSARGALGEAGKGGGGGDVERKLRGCRRAWLRERKWPRGCCVQMGDVTFACSTDVFGVYVCLGVVGGGGRDVAGEGQSWEYKRGHLL